MSAPVGPEVDARTTPPALRGVVLLFLAGAFVYFGACYRYAHETTFPAWVYPGQWQMFTSKETWHHDVIASAELDGVAVKVDLEALIPSTWDSGPRYARGPFRNNPSRMRVLAYSICARMKPTPDVVMLGELKWKARFGVSPSERGAPESKARLEFRCGSDVALPQGRRL
jgi:hypothetical protein